MLIQFEFNLSSLNQEPEKLRKQKFYCPERMTLLRITGMFFRDFNEELFTLVFVRGGGGVALF